MHITKHNQKMLVSSLFIVEKGFYFTMTLSSFFQVRYQKNFIQIRKQIWVKFHIKRMKIMPNNMLFRGKKTLSNVWISYQTNLFSTIGFQSCKLYCMFILMQRFIRITNFRIFELKWYIFILSIIIFTLLLVNKVN